MVSYCYVKCNRSKIKIVLILVVVEDGLVPLQFSSKVLFTPSLNPCCSGRWSRTGKEYFKERSKSVVILVVVEDGLVLHVGLILQLVSESRNPCCSGRWSRTCCSVVWLHSLVSRNPCCSGRWSRTFGRRNRIRCQFPVVILVVVEDGLVQHLILKLL